MIMLEITEGITMENIGDIEALIQKIHKTGLSVSMDDFGSGYSSLNILKELSIDELKLDRVFLSDTRMTQRRDTILKKCYPAGQRPLHNHRSRRHRKPNSRKISLFPSDVISAKVTCFPNPWIWIHSRAV